TTQRIKAHGMPIARSIQRPCGACALCADAIWPELAHWVSRTRVSVSGPPVTHRWHSYAPYDGSVPKCQINFLTGRIRMFDGRFLGQGSFVSSKGHSVLRCADCRSARMKIARAWV